MGRRVWPITALSAILVIAFGLLLISVLSVPVTKSITLCTYGGIQFGVLDTAILKQIHAPPFELDMAM